MKEVVGTGTHLLSRCVLRRFIGLGICPSLSVLLYFVLSLHPCDTATSDLDREFSQSLGEEVACV